MYECRYDERLKTKAEESTHLAQIHRSVGRLWMHELKTFFSSFSWNVMDGLRDSKHDDPVLCKCVRTLLKCQSNDGMCYEDELISSHLLCAFVQPTNVNLQRAGERDPHSCELGKPDQESAKIRDPFSQVVYYVLIPPFYIF